MLNITSTVQLTEEDIKAIIVQHIESLGYCVTGDVEFKMDYTTEKIGGGRFDLKHRKATLGITPVSVRPNTPQEPAKPIGPNAESRRG